MAPATLIQKPSPINGNPAPERISFRAWLSVGILLALTICSYVDRSVIALMVDPIKRDLGVSDFQVSLLQGFAFAFVYAIASVPMGWISDRVSRRAVIMAGVSIWSFATMACGLASSYWHIFVARFGVGIGEAALPPSAYGIVAEQFPKRRLSLGIGILAAGAALGSAVALMLSGIAIAWGQKYALHFGLADWQFVFLLVGLPGLILMPLVLLIPRPVRQAKAAPLMEDNRDYTRWMRRHGRYIVLLSLGVGCYAAVLYAMSAWVPSYLMRRFALDAQTVGFSVGSIHMATGLLGFIGSGWIVDRLHAAKVKDSHFRYLLATGAIAFLAGIPCYFWVDSLTLTYFLIFIINVASPVTSAALGHVQLASPARFHGRTVALFQLLMNLFAMVVGPSSAALFAEKMFGGPAHLGEGLGMTIVILVPIGTVLILLACAGGRRAMAERSEG